MVLLSNVIDNQFYPLLVLGGGNIFNPRLALWVVVQERIHINPSLLTLLSVLAAQHLLDHILHVSVSIRASDGDDGRSEFGCVDVGEGSLQKGELGKVDVGNLRGRGGDVSGGPIRCIVGGPGGASCITERAGELGIWVAAVAKILHRVSGQFRKGVLELDNLVVGRLGKVVVLAFLLYIGKDGGE